MGWCTVLWNRLLFKIALVSQFLHVLRNFEICGEVWWTAFSFVLFKRLKILAWNILTGCKTQWSSSCWDKNNQMCGTSQLVNNRWNTKNLHCIYHLMFVSRVWPTLQIMINTLRPRQNDCLFADDIFKHIFIPPASTKLKGGYTGITLSVCPSVDKIVSALYLQQYSSDPFHICTSYQATSEGVSRGMPVSKFKNLKFLRIF